MLRTPFQTLPGCSWKLQRITEVQSPVVQSCVDSTYSYTFIYYIIYIYIHIHIYSTYVPVPVCSHAAHVSDEQGPPCWTLRLWTRFGYSWVEGPPRFSGSVLASESDSELHDASYMFILLGEYMKQQ